MTFWDALDEVISTHDSRAVAAAVVRRVAAVHIDGPVGAFANDPPSPTELVECALLLDEQDCTPDRLGDVWEYLITPADRRTQGAHFTPRPVAEEVVAMALDAARGPVVSVWDPTSGGGAFLLAAARALEEGGHRSKAEIVVGLHASDVDETALSVCDAALELWCHGAARPVTSCCDALLDLGYDWPDGFDLIVGNPPFLGQLTTDTARHSKRREMLSTRYAEIATAYLDEAGLFVELAGRRRSESGAIGMVVPQSLLGAVDARHVRGSATARSRLAGLWIDHGQSFAAAVDTAALILAGGESVNTLVVRGTGSDAKRFTAPEPTASSWASLLAVSMGVPQVSIANAATLADLASVTAGFRQHFYGISDAVANNDSSPDSPRLITSGAIEPLRSLWGQRSVRFSGSRWDAPVVVVDQIADSKVRAWFTDRMRPKLLLASQTKVVEVLVDPDAQMVPSVPVVSVEPNSADDLWLLASMLSAPAVSAWMLHDAAGTGLSHDAIRIRAKALGSVPQPRDEVAWRDGSEEARAAHECAVVGDERNYVHHLRALAKTMNAAYGVDTSVGAWWWQRIRLPQRFTTEAY